ncbi:MAG: DNA primase, partial [Tumebacillaceae bacterium]
MRRRIPEETVERVRQHFDIVDIIGEHVRLKKSGRSYMGNCPFHNEKSPSFSVSQDKQLYHCFGCGASGNLFSFIMEKEGVSFSEAVEQLANRANIPLPMEEMEDVESPEYKRRKEMFRAHDLAAKYYHHILMNTEVGLPGLRYLQSRGLSRTTIETFQIGFAPNAWDVLRKFLVEKRGFAEDLLAEAGLLSESANHKGKYFDKFRNRVMFPIHDGQGQVIGFGGRVMAKDEKPKYLNSPETPLFHKGRHLYNLHRARGPMRKDGRVLLLEGYMDVIAAHQSGVENVVAVLGTAMTPDHMRLLQRNVQEIVMMFDGDAAGQRAALRSADVVKDTDVTTRVATLPEGLDPDEFLKKYGKDAFERAVLDNSTSMTTFRVLALRKEHNLATDKGKEDYLRDAIAKVLVEVDSPIELEKQFRELSDEFGISVEALKQEWQMARKTTSGGDKPDRKWNTNRNNA